MGVTRLAVLLLCSLSVLTGAGCGASSTGPIEVSITGEDLVRDGLLFTPNPAPGQPVYEPFSGSGTTLIAAETTGRVCLAVELDPAYVDVAVQRWQAFTGRTASLDDDGRSFAEIAAAERRAGAAA